MKRFFFLIFSLLLSIICFGQSKGKIQFNGSMDTSFQFLRARDYDENSFPHSLAGKFGFGWQNQANLRLKSQINDFFSFGFSFNITTLTGSYTDIYRSYFSRSSVSMAQEYEKIPDPTDPTNPTKEKIYPTGNLLSNSFYSIPFYYKATYIGAFEIERLYFKAGNRFFDIESGILRLSYGYGVVFRPNDFFNPPNPLNLQGRPEGVLSFVANFYPADMIKLQALAVAPDNPVESGGWDFKFGTTATMSISKVNLQFMYMFLLPQIEYLKDPESINLPKYFNNDFTHLIGFSLKADVVVGLTFEAQYRFEQRAFRTGQYYGDRPFYGFEGLQAAIGVDYTIIGRIYILLEYMFYGSGMVNWWESTGDTMYIDNPRYGLQKEDWYKIEPIERQKMFNLEKKPLYYLRHNYINGMIRVKAHDICFVGGSFLFGIDDVSAYLTLFTEISPMQAFTITLTMAAPIDRTTFGISGEAGEFSSSTLGYLQLWSVSVKVKF